MKWIEFCVCVLCALSVHLPIHNSSFVVYTYFGCMAMPDATSDEHNQNQHMPKCSLTLPLCIRSVYTIPTSYKCAERDENDLWLRGLIRSRRSQRFSPSLKMCLDSLNTEQLSTDDGSTMDEGLHFAMCQQPNVGGMNEKWVFSNACLEKCHCAQLFSLQVSFWNVRRPFCRRVEILSSFGFFCCCWENTSDLCARECLCMSVLWFYSADGHPHRILWYDRSVERKQIYKLMRNSDGAASVQCALCMMPNGIYGCSHFQQILFRLWTNFSIMTMICVWHLRVQHFVVIYITSISWRHVVKVLVACYKSRLNRQNCRNDSVVRWCCSGLSNALVFFLFVLKSSLIAGIVSLFSI